MDTKSRPLYMLFTRDPPQVEEHIQTENEGLKIFHANGNQKKVETKILTSDRL